MTQTGKTIVGGIAVLLLVLLLVSLGARSMRTDLESESRATSTQTGGATTSEVIANQQDPLDPLKGVTTEEGKKCVAAGGVWNETFRECAAVKEGTCKSIGGTYNECASPCRNDPSAEVCMEMCVQICSFK